MRGPSIQLGEEPHHRAIATAIERARRSSPIRTTLELADIVAAAVPSTGGRAPKRSTHAGMGPSRIHAATRTFQALRIFVNREVRGTMHPWERAGERRARARAG